MRLLSVMIVAACSAPQPSPGSAGPATAAGSGSGSAPASPAVLEHSGQLRGHLGQRVTIRGTARDAKLAAAIVLDGGPVYCLGVDSWPGPVSGTQVAASGTLIETDQFAAKPGPNGEINQGTDGSVIALRDCQYTLP
jgi:hypothetical protein